ncbi:MAG: uracil phosphoribosyltransferase [Pseudomonadota bacterium]
MYAQLVELLDAGKLPGVMNYADLHDAVRRALDLAHMEGKLKNDITSDPERFIEIDPDLPLSLLDMKHAGKKLALISILRAGQGLLDGVLDLIPSARVGFVGLYRDEATLKPVQYYYKVPNLAGRVTIALDPMLATGNSSAAAIDLLKASGATDVRFVCLLAAPEGVARMAEAHPDVRIVTAAVDERLNEVGYIVPGLGDAGDRMFGTK